MIKLSVKKSGLKAILNSHTLLVQSKLRHNVDRLKVALVEATPIDTGFARASWSVERPDATRYLIKNDAPYIGALNEGHSTQAPAHFIEQTALRFGRASGLIVREIDS